MRRLRIPAALALGAAATGCGSPMPGPDGDAGFDAGGDAGLDAGYDAGVSCETAPPLPADWQNDAGERCGCLIGGLRTDGGFSYFSYCDPDIGNPCTLGCFNPKEADGGREYSDAGTPVCFC